MKRHPLPTDPDRKHTFVMTERKAELIHKIVDSHSQALKNWIVGHVENGDLVSAQELAHELREYHSLFAAFNMQAKREIAGWGDKELVVEHVVREGRFP